VPKLENEIEEARKLDNEQNKKNIAENKYSLNQNVMKNNYLMNSHPVHGLVALETHENQALLDNK
jgi:hypothetical protein